MYRLLPWRGFHCVKIERLYRNNLAKLQKHNLLVEYHVLHMYARKNVEVRTCLFEGIDQVVRHVGSNARLSIYPSIRRARQISATDPSASEIFMHELRPLLSQCDQFNEHKDALVGGD